MEINKKLTSTRMKRTKKNTSKLYHEKVKVESSATSIS